MVHEPNVKPKYENAIDSIGIALNSNKMEEKSADCFV